jgi:hypothetical protein
MGSSANHVRLTSHFTMVHDPHPGLVFFFIVVFNLVKVLFYLLICFECFVSSVGLEHNDIWHTEEANVRPSLSDRSHKSSKKVLNTLMKRTIAPPWAIVRCSK